MCILFYFLCKQYTYGGYYPAKVDNMVNFYAQMYLKCGPKILPIQYKRNGKPERLYFTPYSTQRLHVAMHVFLVDCRG